MTNTPPKILITRPTNDAQKTSKFLKSLGYESDIAPMLEIIYTPRPLPAIPWYGAVFTSKNAVSAIKKMKNFSPSIFSKIYFVGKETQNEFAHAWPHYPKESFVLGKGDGQALAEHIAKEETLINGPLLWPCGDAIAFDLCKFLRIYHIDIVPLQVYQSKMADFIPDIVVSDLKADRYDAVLFYSARSAQAFSKAWKKSTKTDRLIIDALPLCMSKRIATQIIDIFHHVAAVSEKPNEFSLISLLQSLIPNISTGSITE